VKLLYSFSTSYLVVPVVVYVFSFPGLFECLFPWIQQELLAVEGYYLRQEGYVIVGVCFSFSNFAQKHLNGFT